MPVPTFYLFVCLYVCMLLFIKLFHIKQNFSPGKQFFQLFSNDEISCMISMIPYSFRSFFFSLSLTFSTIPYCSFLSFYLSLFFPLRVSHPRVSGGGGGGGGGATGVAQDWCYLYCRGS